MAAEQSIEVRWVGYFLFDRPSCKRPDNEENTILRCQLEKDESSAVRKLFFVHVNACMEKRRAGVFHLFRAF